MHQHPRRGKLLPVKDFLGIGVEGHRDSKEPVDALFLGVPAHTVHDPPMTLWPRQNCLHTKALTVPAQLF